MTRKLPGRCLTHYPPLPDGREACCARGPIRQSPARPHPPVQQQFQPSRCAWGICLFCRSLTSGPEGCTAASYQQQHCSSTAAAHVHEFDCTAGPLSTACGRATFTSPKGQCDGSIGGKRSCVHIFWRLLSDFSGRPLAHVRQCQWASAAALWRAGRELLGDQRPDANVHAA